jgi:hypothetical protein
MIISTLIAPPKPRTPFVYFYITAKVHKTTWKTRPVVSIAGSITHGLGCWLGQQLQPICKKLPSYLKSSLKLKTKQLESITLDTSRIHFFTADTTSMYTNINTDHALEKISFPSGLLHWLLALLKKP